MKKLSLVVLILLFFVAGWSFAAPVPKIAVAAMDKTVAAAVSNQPGVSPYFLIFDQKGKLLETIENPYKNADSPGPSVVNFLAQKGATVIVAGNFGPKIVEVMKAKSITVVSFTGTVADAVKQALKSK